MSEENAMDVHQRLKEKTYTYHQEIERGPLINQLINDSINMADYHILLKKFHAYILPCESAILSSSWSSLLDNREKTGKLTSDLLDLEIYNNRQYQVLPPLHTREEILGYLYVFEGATLGGQIIAKVLKKRLGLTAKYGAKYFNGYGPDTIKMWLDFCNILNQANTVQEPQILASATITYTLLINYMNQDWSSSET